MKTLLFLGCKPSKSEVNLIIWVYYIFPCLTCIHLQEVDDDLDGFVSKEEF